MQLEKRPVDHYNSLCHHIKNYQQILDFYNFLKYSNKQNQQKTDNLSAML